MTTRPQPIRRTLALAGASLALAALGATATAGPAAALGRVCPPGAPNCSPEAVPGGGAGWPDGASLARGGWPDGTPGNTNVKCPSGQPSCDPEN